MCLSRFNDEEMLNIHFFKMLTDNVLSSNNFNLYESFSLQYYKHETSHFVEMILQFRYHLEIAAKMSGLEKYDRHFVLKQNSESIILTLSLFVLSTLVVLLISTFVLRGAWLLKILYNTPHRAVFVE